MRWLFVAGLAVVLLVGGRLQAAVKNAVPGHDAAVPGTDFPIIHEIEFVGLRHISPAAVQAQISSRLGEHLDVRRVESDVEALGRLEWFSDVRVEMQPMPQSPASSLDSSNYVRLIFLVSELPFLAKLDFAGSKLLSASQIKKILADNKVMPRFGEPAAPERLALISRMIRSALAELGHPHSQIQTYEELAPNATVRVRFAIDDGPHLPVGRIEFDGRSGVSEKLLRREMRRTAPNALFASWRGKNAFTFEGFAEDRARILSCYHNQGFPEACIGSARTIEYTATKGWLSWRRDKIERRLTVIIPVEAGPLYRFAAVNVSPELANAAAKSRPKLLAFSNSQSGAAYSAKAAEDLRRAWTASVQPRHREKAEPPFLAVELSRSFDPQAHTVQLRIGPANEPPIRVRRVEFLGLHRFRDRYLRKRIGLTEGQPLDDRALEAGLARLAKTGYFRQIKKQDIRVRADDITRSADVTIRVSEAGRQRTYFSGGQGHFGSTLGVAYSLFDLLRCEDLLSAQFDAGPQSLQLALGLIMEGFLGSRSSLAFSIFNNTLRPRLTSPVKGPFYVSQSEGLNTTWGYALTNADSLALNYSLSHMKTNYSLALPAPLTNSPGSSLSANSSSSSLGLAWTRDVGHEKFSTANSASGGLLGGSENVLRSNQEFARLFPDPLFSHQNSWAFRTTFSAAGSYSGAMPLYARLFSGDAQVRGLGNGELGPYSVVPQGGANSAAETYTAIPAGANIVTAANVEYRFPLRDRVQAAVFFDLGSGRILPGWLGPARPVLLSSTNAALHGSVGFELRWTVPEIQVPVRTYLALNVIRLNRFLSLPDGSLFHAHNRLFAFGWALGTLF